MSNSIPYGAWSDARKPQAYITWTAPGTGLVQTFTFDNVITEKWDDDASITEHPVETGANVADHVRVALEKCELTISSTNEPTGVNAYGIGIPGEPVTLDVPTPSWVPGPNTLIVPEFDNQIALRSLAGELVGLAVGALGAGALVRDIAGVAVLEVADLLLPGITIPTPVSTTAGLLPPSPTPAVVAQVEQWTTPPTDFVALTHKQMTDLKSAAQVIQVYGTKQVNLSMVIESLAFSRDASTGSGESLVVGFKEIRIVSTQTVVAPIPNLPAGGGKSTQKRGGQNPAAAPTAQQLSALLRLGARAGLTPEGFAKLLGASSGGAP